MSMTLFGRRVVRTWEERNAFGAERSGWWTDCYDFEGSLKLQYGPFATEDDAIQEGELWKDRVLDLHGEQVDKIIKVEDWTLTGGDK